MSRTPDKNRPSPAELEERCGRLADALEQCERRQRRTEEALRLAERRYRIAVESQRELVCEFTPDTTLTYVNEAYCRFFQKSPEELLGRSFLTLLPESAHAGVRVHLADLLANPREVFYEHEVILPDGRIGWQQWIDYPIRDADGNVVEFQSVARDVTERKRAEEALRDSEEKWRSITENSPDYIMTVDLDGTILFINRTVPELDRARVIGTRVWDHLSTEDGERMRACLARVLATGEADRCDVAYESAGVGTRYFESRVGPIKRAGSTVGFAITSHDVTQRRRAEEERRRLEETVQRAQKLESLGALAGGVAHDFNNLLQAILGNADLALRELPAAGNGRVHVESVIKAAERAAELCRQMLTYAGRSQPVKRPIDLSRTTAEILELVKVSISKKAELRCDFAPDLPAIEADPAQVRQVILNLVTNASEALGDGPGLIELSLRCVDCERADLDRLLIAEGLPEGRYVRLTASDTGCGMDPETATRIFEPFFTTKFTGRGLGLATVLGIVRAHRGGLGVDSARGRGTTVEVLFPASTRAATDETADLPADEAGPPRRGLALVAEDEPLVRGFVSKLLEGAGFEVVTAADGHEALALFRARRRELALVLLDMTMPGLSGDEVYEEIRRAGDDLPVILTSGRAGEIAAEQRRAGRATFLQKPYRAVDLLARIEESLAGRR